MCARNESHLRTYGIDVAQRDAMAEAQNFLCYTCDTPEPDTRGGRLCLDHCHATGTIRRLLCHMCNVALGYVKDNPATLRRLAAMLEEHVPAEEATR